MANNIQTITNYVNKLLNQKFYEKDLLTAVLENNNPLITFHNGGKQVNIPSMELSGLRNYSRSSGWKDGSTTFAYELHDMLWDRGIKLGIDSMDNEENLGLIVGNLIEELNVQAIRPEVDAVRFATLASKADKIVSGTIDPTKVVKALMDALGYLNDNEVLGEEMFCFVSYETLGFIRQTPELSRQLTQVDYKSKVGITFTVHKLENLLLIPVPKRRFKTEVTLLDTADGGFENPVTAKDINFLIVHPDSTFATIKHSPLRIVGPDSQTEIDGYLLLSRLYHTLIVPSNKETGIYLHHKA